MERSSETVATLVAALAKAQVELTNPDKSLIAVLPAERGQPPRSFRYASLAAGLEIVRKTLGRHELATFQSTTIDRDSGMIKLTTTLAHSSGEWVASDWPVCSLADLTAPHRMGAALSYARRYALFTLVGIAGEDDLDAPDLAACSHPMTSVVSSQPAASTSPAKTATRTPQKISLKDSSCVADASRQDRDRLLEELASVTGRDALADWAKRSVAVKNTMTTEDAIAVETSFELKAQQLEGSGAVATPSSVAASYEAQDEVPNRTARPHGTVDRSELTFGHSPRRRNKLHLKFVATQPCLVCDRRPCDAHHLRFAQPVALGRKVSDEFTVPLCRTHHRELHRSGNERKWWKATKGEFDPLEVARKLWNHPQGAV